MPLVITPAHYDANHSVTQSRLEWILTEQGYHDTRQPGAAHDFDLYFAIVIEPQIEMFSRDAVVDDNFVFGSLVEKWRSQRGATSSITEIILCPAYQSIIGMGPKAILLILSQLESERDNPDHWFWALQALTKANPVREEDEGNLVMMSRAWRDWAVTEGYAW